MLRYTPFLDALASINDETNPTWKTIVAGLVVLRLTDDWLDLDTTIVKQDADGLRTVRSTIDAIPQQSPIRSLLHIIVATLVTSRGHPLRRIATYLYQYGRALHDAGQWSLAKSVSGALVYRAQQYNETAIYLKALLQFAYITKHLYQFQEARTAYALASNEAKRLNDIHSQLHVEMSLATLIAAQEGELEVADQVLQTTIHKARRYDDGFTICNASQERGRISHLRGDYIGLIQHSHVALEHTHRDYIKHGIICNIAAGLAELGRDEQAIDIYLGLLAQCHNENIRHQSLLNLLELTIRSREQQSFHAYRRLLHSASMATFYKISYHQYLSMGYEVFGYSDKAAYESGVANQMIAASQVNTLL